MLDINSVKEINEIESKSEDLTALAPDVRDYGLEQNANESLKKIYGELEELNAQKEKALNNQSPNMQTGILSKIVVTPLKEPSQNGVVALATVTVDNAVTINSITIREKKDKSGYYVMMPQKRTVDGKFMDVAHPLNASARLNLNTKLLEMYQSGNFNFIDNAETQKVYAPKFRAQNCYKFHNNENRTKARLDLVVSNFVIHNAKIVEKHDGENMLSMPSYQDKNGEYHTIVTPKNSEAFQQLNNVALQEFNKEYQYLRVTDSEVQSLKDAGIPFKTPVNEDIIHDGKTLIQFEKQQQNTVTSVLSSVAQSAPTLK